jgi:C-terminal processing protease CtpA/Prc
MTLTTVPGKRLPVIDVLLLTSSKTFSAAEAFAFALAENDRVTIVGETTGGGGNAGDYVDIGHGFQAFVPDVHVSSPYNDTSWEGRGVEPSIKFRPNRRL